METDRYNKIIEFVCEYNDVSMDELFNILKYKECRYMLFLLLRRYGCDNKELIKGILNVESQRKMSQTYKKAEEKLFVNREFRDKYLELEKKIEKII